MHARFSFLVLFVILTAVTCLAALGAEPDGGLRLATFRCDVTPPVGGHPLIWITPVAQVEDPLWANGVVLEDRGRRYVLCAVDWCGLCNSTYELFRSKIASAAKTEVSQVAVQCVHQHTAPYTDADAQKLLDATEQPPRYADLKFLEQLTDRLAAAVKASLDRLEPFDRVGIGQAKVDRVASTRRIIVNGKFFGRASSAKDPKLRALPEGTIDPLLRTITLARGDKPLVRLHYYATHPQSFYGDPRASADVPGIARGRLEKKEGVFQIYFTGCAGDVAMGKYNDGTPRARAELADRLYVAMDASAAATRWSPVSQILWRTVPVTLPLRSDRGYTLADNRARMADPKLSPIHRIRAANRVAFAQRIDRPLELSLVRLGPASIVHLPGECMIDFQLFTQSLRPGEFVAVAAYGDLGPGYICTAQAFKEGGYEPSASAVSPEGEEVLKNGIRRLFEQDRDPPGK